jgi:hypothetical protein
MDPCRKLLSLWSPWWWFIIKNIKLVENREWEHSPSYRGPVWIHAALKGEDDPAAIVTSVFEDEQFAVPAGMAPPTMEELAAGAGHIVGRARIVDVARNTEAVCAADPWAAEGQLGLRLADVEALPVPIPWKGAQGLVGVDPEMVALVALISKYGHKLDFAAVPETIARWLVCAQHNGTNTNDLFARAVDQKQLRREGQVYFTRAYKKGTPPRAPSPSPAPPAPVETSAPPVDPRQTTWGW